MVEAIRKLVRPIVTIALTATAIYGFVAGLIPWEGFGPFVGTAIGFWFATRSAERKGEEKV